MRDRSIEFGTLFAFVAYIAAFFLPIRDLSARYTLLQSGMAGAERIFELLENDDEDAPPTEAGEAKPRPRPRPGRSPSPKSYGRS